MMTNKIMAILGLITALAGVISYLSGTKNLMELLGLSESPAIVAEVPRHKVKCGLDVGVVEQAICADERIRRKDETLALLYLKAQSHMDPTDLKRLHDSEVGWINARTTCEHKADLHRCISDLYDQRIATLRDMDR